MRFQLGIAEDFSAGGTENPAAVLSQRALLKLLGLVPALHFGIPQGQEKNYILETHSQLQVCDDFKLVLVVLSCD